MKNTETSLFLSICILTSTLIFSFSKKLFTLILSLHFHVLIIFYPYFYPFHHFKPSFDILNMGNTISASRFKISKKKQKEPENNGNGTNYIIKINDVQIDRIQQMHHILKTCSKGNFISPISRDLSRGIKVLDVGSGPGTWVFDMSSDYRKSKFIGIEVQAFMLPTIHPSNTSFVNNDILEGIPFPPGSFDYIHMRCMTLCFT